MIYSRYPVYPMRVPPIKVTGKCSKCGHVVHEVTDGRRVTWRGPCPACKEAVITARIPAPEKVEKPEQKRKVPRAAYTGGPGPSVRPGEDQQADGQPERDIEPGSDDDDDGADHARPSGQQRGRRGGESPEAEPGPVRQASGEYERRRVLSGYGHIY